MITEQVLSVPDLHCIVLLLATMTNCCQLFHRGLLLLLAWNMLMDFYDEFMTIVSFKLFSTSLSSELKGWIVPFSALSVLLPVVGWVGDSLLGRYRAIIVLYYCYIYYCYTIVIMYYCYCYCTCNNVVHDTFQAVNH